MGCTVLSNRELAIRNAAPMASANGTATPVKWLAVMADLPASEKSERATLIVGAGDTDTAAPPP